MNTKISDYLGQSDNMGNNKPTNTKLHDKADSDKKSDSDTESESSYFDILCAFRGSIV